MKTAKALILCDSRRLANEVIDLVNALSSTEVLVLTSDSVIQERMRAESIATTLIRSPVREGRVLGQRQFTRLQKIFAKLNLRWATLMTDLALGLSYFLSSINERQAISNLLHSFDPDVIVVESDRSLGTAAVLIASSKTVGKAKILLSIQAIVDLEGTLYNRHRKPTTWPEAFPPLVMRWMKKNYSANIYPFKQTEGRFFFSLAEVFYLKMIKALPPKPWTVGSTAGTLSLVPNLMQEEQLKANGTLASSIVRIGSSEMNTVFAKNQSSLAAKKASDRLKVYVALPQLLEHEICSAEAHWAQIDSLKDLATIADFEVVYFLHPRMDRQLYLKRFNGLNISSSPLVDKIGSCDVFVASYSSTVPWALVCNIPVVIVDMTGINISTFDIYTSVHIVKDAPSIAATIRKAFAAKVDKNSYLLAGGDVFDGRYGQRFESLILSSKAGLN